MWGKTTKQRKAAIRRNRILKARAEAAKLRRARGALKRAAVVIERGRAGVRFAP
jgi:hypothetical protein